MRFKQYRAIVGFLLVILKMHLPVLLPVFSYTAFSVVLLNSAHSVNSTHGLRQQLLGVVCGALAAQDRVQAGLSTRTRKRHLAQFLSFI